MASQYRDFFSDAYKDEHGFRPHGNWSDQEIDRYFEGRDARMKQQELEEYNHFYAEVQKYKGKFFVVKGARPMNNAYTGFYAEVVAIRPGKDTVLMFSVCSEYAKGGVAWDHYGWEMLSTDWHTSLNGRDPQKFLDALLRKLS